MNIRLAAPTKVHATELEPGLLRAAGLELEPVVMLEPTADGLAVRKLTPAEKAAHAQRTGESAFLGSDEEFDAFLRAVPAADDPTT